MLVVSLQVFVGGQVMRRGGVRNNFTGEKRNKEVIGYPVSNDLFGACLYMIGNGITVVKTSEYRLAPPVITSCTKIKSFRCCQMSVKACGVAIILNILYIHKSHTPQSFPEKHKHLSSKPVHK